MMKGRILLLEDDESLRRGICFKLEKEGYEVLACAGIQEGMRLWNNSEIDLVICDITLEDGSGLDFCREIRRISNVRFMFLTAMDQEIDIVMGYEAGADDYVVKPFNIRELLLRIRAILRRQVMVESNPVLTRHGVSVDPAAHKVTVLGQDVELTATEFRLIEDLLRNAGRVRTREELLAAVWGYQFEGYARTVDTHIRRLRNKLGDAAEIIETVRGVGYRCKE